MKPLASGTGGAQTTRATSCTRGTPRSSTNAGSLSVHERRSAGVKPARAATCPAGRAETRAVSYTHLTLPTICSV
eukprot:12451767-Alexandrium_andersonii.AAC.1